jgi:hypothetical protein
VLDPATIDTTLESRAITFENPTGARGAGGTAAGGRKGAPMRVVGPGETVSLADIDGPGTVRHLWLTVELAPPEVLRALVLEVFYDGAHEPSIAVPVLDFFACPHGRPVDHASALVAVQEGRGFNSFVPMPFAGHLRVELRNESPESTMLYYQLDLTLERSPSPGAGYLHVPFRRENPTTLRQDFTIVDGLAGPGRFLGCAVGVRVIDEGTWYGEGEVKVYLDGDGDLPTICGTGLEDYVGSAWGLGAHAAPYGGAPLVVGPFVGFYRWHVPDPIMFARDLRVTIQQIGTTFFPPGHEEQYRAFRDSHEACGFGWLEGRGSLLALGMHERVDDYCAAAFLYCAEPQPVPRVDVRAATADIGRTTDERPHPFEAMRGSFAP